MMLYIIQFSVDRGSARPPPAIQPDDPFQPDSSESESVMYYKNLCTCTHFLMGLVSYTKSMIDHETEIF